MVLSNMAEYSRVKVKFLTHILLVNAASMVVEWFCDRAYYSGRVNAVKTVESTRSEIASLFRHRSTLLWIGPDAFTVQNLTETLSWVNSYHLIEIHKEEYFRK